MHVVFSNLDVLLCFCILHPPVAPPAPRSHPSDHSSPNKAAVSEAMCHHWTSYLDL